MLSILVIDLLEFELITNFYSYPLIVSEVRNFKCNYSHSVFWSVLSFLSCFSPWTQTLTVSGRRTSRIMKCWYRLTKTVGKKEFLSLLLSLYFVQFSFIDIINPTEWWTRKGGKCVKEIGRTCMSVNILLLECTKELKFFIFRRLCPDLFFFQRATDFPCDELVNASSYVETLRKRVEHTALKSETVAKNRLGITFNVRFN